MPPWLTSQLAIFISGLTLLGLSPSDAAESRPNVLFIAVDDLRPELGCYGAPHIHSPNIDRFAQTAVRFDRAYCQQAVCNPSRTSLMTGLRPDTIGVVGNHLHFRSKMPDVVTLPQLFKHHSYHACISYIDAQIGRVLGELERLGLADNTIVSLYGDHGYHLGEQGLWGKTTNFELDTRVPLIIRAPGMKAAGMTSASLVELVDLYPTLADLAGLPVGEHLEGKSLSSLLDDPTKTIKAAALSQYPRGGGLMGYSMRTPTH